MANSSTSFAVPSTAYGSECRPNVLKTTSVTITLRQPAAVVLQKGGPPSVKEKPMRMPAKQAYEDFDFPAPPPRAEMSHPVASKPSSSLEDELDSLTNLLKLNLENTDDPEFFGICHRCHTKISGDGNGCTAMGEVYHVSCFACNDCKKKLTGLEFYCVEDSPYCESCYLSSLENCRVCSKKITERILRAVDGTFHPECFVCCSCRKHLDGIPFTVDATKAVHCVECYQMKFSPRCAACEKLIMPTNDRGETVHIVSMQKNFHVECYKCEDCGELLSSEEGRGCYPLDGHLLCQPCNLRRSQTSDRKRDVSRNQSTEL